MNDAQLAAQLAYHAGQILRAVRNCDLISGKMLGEAGDATANQFLCHAIRQHRSDDGLLSEECQDSAERLGKERVWIIDPVDGTREYGEARSDWAVHVALAINGQPEIGAVALPDCDMVLSSDSPVILPAPSQILPAPSQRPRIVVSRTRPSALADFLAQKIEAQLVPMGSSGAKAMAVVRGDAEIYLHSGGQYEWDSCAPVAVARACGLHCSRINGNPLVYNQPDTYLPDLLICRREWADIVLSHLADSAREMPS